MTSGERRSVRRLLQFSLRTLFVLMVLAAVLCGTIGVRMVYVCDQRAVARRLESVDSHVLNVTSTGPPTTTITWEESSQLGMAPNVLVRSLLGEEFFSNVVEISLRYKQRLTDDDLEMISRLDHLRRLDLSLTPIGDAGLRHLGELPRLEVLQLGSTNVSGAGLEFLERAPQLQALGLGFTLVDDACVARLAARHPELRRLDLTSTAITDAALASLAKCKSLETLILCDTDVTSAGVAQLRGLPRLRVVALNNTAVDDEAMSALATLPALEELYLRHLAITDAGMEALADAAKLRLLQICGTEVTDAGVAQLAKIKTLKMLDLRGLDVSDDGIAKLAGLDLELLLVQNTSVTPGGLARLAHVPPDVEAALAKILAADLGPTLQQRRAVTQNSSKYFYFGYTRLWPANVDGEMIPFPRLVLVGQDERARLNQLLPRQITPAQRELLDGMYDSRLAGEFSIE